VLEFPAAGTPAGRRRAPTTLVTKPAEKTAACEGRILVLDDEKAIAENAERDAGPAGYTTVVCTAAAQALA